MAHTVLTIGRQFGSGGRIVAQRVAEALHIPFYDKAVIDLAAKETGLSEEFIRQAEQKKTSSFLYNLYMSTQNLPVSDQVFIAESDVIRKVAAQGPCVIVGRCADFILQDRTDCLKVFIHADMKFRADRIVRVYGEREKSPEARLKEKDKRRAAYYRFYTDMNWGNAANYHIALDSGVIGIEKSAEIIESLA